MEAGQGPNWDCSANGKKSCPVPVTVAERSEACSVFALSEAAIVGSNPSEGMDV
jgi:hypothetical protein